MLPDAVAEIELDGPIEMSLWFADNAYAVNGPIPDYYTDLYLFLGEQDRRGNYAARLRLFLVPAESATLVRQLRALAGLIESRTTATIAADGTVTREQSAGEIAHPNFVYRLADGTPLMGPCDTEGCKYASKPGGARHDGECSNAAFDAEKEQGA